MSSHLFVLTYFGSANVFFQSTNLYYSILGLINVGDEVKEINGITFHGKDPKDMTQILVGYIFYSQ